MKELSEFTDADLIRSYQSESKAEFIGELYRRYSLLVFGLCYKYLRNTENAKDATSDIFELILRKLKTHDVTFFRSWIFVVSKNYLVRIHRRRKEPDAEELEILPEKFMESKPDWSLHIREYESKRLRDALDNLNSDQRTCIELFYLKELPYCEVSTVTGFDLNKVKSCIQNGKRNLKVWLEDGKPLYE